MRTPVDYPHKTFRGKLLGRPLSGRNAMSGTFVFAVSSLFVSSVLYAQVTTATLLGTVKDSSGAAVPNAGVSAKNLATGLARSVTTGDDGNYVISNLPAGHYSVT